MAVTGAGRLSVRKRLKLWWGKLRRFYLGHFRPGYVRRNQARRRGECKRCGACCQLGLRCWQLRHTSQTTECVRHERRPLNCRLFPIDERDLSDRDVINPLAPCGFSFDAQAPASGEHDEDAASS